MSQVYSMTGYAAAQAPLPLGDHQFGSQKRQFPLFGSHASHGRRIEVHGNGTPFDSHAVGRTR